MRWLRADVKNVPLRTCVACGAKKPQAELMRVAARGGTLPCRDEGGSLPGRGAYLCLARACIEKAFHRNSLQRGLKLKEKAPAELKIQLLAMVQEK